MNRLFAAEHRAIKLIASACFLACGAAGLAVAASFQASEGPYIAKWMNLVQSAGVTPSNVNTSATIILIGGIVGLGAGLLGVASAFVKPMGRALMLAAIAAAAVSGILMLALGAAVGSDPFKSVVGGNTYVYNLNRADQQLSGQQLQMQMVGLALFDQCCRPTPALPNNTWFSQYRYGACGQTCPGDDPAKPGCTGDGYGLSGYICDQRIKIVENLVDLTKLCTCVPTGTATQTYDAVKAYITPAVCDDMNRIRIEIIDAVYIPTTTVTLGFVRSNLFQSTPIIKAPVIGYRDDPATDPTHRTQTGYGFGCGLGFPKGVMWYQEMYYDQVIAPLSTSGVAVGATMLALAACTLAAGFFVAYSEIADEKQDQWEGSLAANWNRMDHPSGAIQPETNPGPVPNVQNGNGVMNGNGMAVQNPQYKPGVGVQVVGGPAAAGSDLLGRLRDFYHQHDPKKDDADVVGIAKWGQQNGIVALNKKLRDKYGADLDSAGPPI